MSARADVWTRAAAWSLDAIACALVVGAAFGARIATDAHRLEQRTLDMFMQAYEAMARHAGFESALPDIGAMLGDAALRHAVVALEVSLLQALAWPTLAFMLAMAVLQALGEASARGASPGKRALGLRVTGRDGMRLRFGRALMRQLAGLVSWLTLNIGHLLAAGPRRLALHDRLAGTQVLQARTPPRWTCAWLLMLAAAMVVATVAIAMRLASLAALAAQRVFG